MKYLCLRSSLLLGYIVFTKQFAQILFSLIKNVILHILILCLARVIQAIPVP